MAKVYKMCMGPHVVFEALHASIQSKKFRSCYHFSIWHPSCHNCSWWTKQSMNFSVVRINTATVYGKQKTG